MNLNDNFDEIPEEKEVQRELTEKEQEAEREKMEMLLQADKIKGQQLGLDFEGDFVTEDELKKMVLGGVQDPTKMHEVYYAGISKLLKENLPIGPSFQQARDYVYEEKNCFLTRGHRIKEDGRRGADSRMGYLEDAEIVLTEVISWVVRRGTSVDIYLKLRDMNIARGYGVPAHEK